MKNRKITNNFENNIIIFLLKKKIIKKNYTIKEINESLWNKVFFINNIFIKISENKNNLKNEFYSLTSLNSKYIPKAIFYDSFFWYNNKQYYILWISKINWKLLEHFRWKININKKLSIIKKLTNTIKYIHWKQNIKWIQTICNYRNNIILYGKYKSNPDIDKKYIEKWIKKIKLLTKKIYNEKKYLTHNDIWHKNIIIDNSFFSWIIDFELSLLAPLRFEYYWILLTNFFTSNENCWNSWEFEKDFIKKLINNIKKNYKEMINNLDKNEFLSFCFIYYLKKLWQYNEKRYNKNETKFFMKKIEIYTNNIFKELVEIQILKK